MKLIDKSALVAEIERLKTIYNDDENIHHIAKYNILVDILSFLDTLEEPEFTMEIKEKTIEEQQQSQAILYGLDGRNPQEDKPISDALKNDFNDK